METDQPRGRLPAAAGTADGLVTDEDQPRIGLVVLEGRRIRAVNSTLCEMLGYERAQLIALDWDAISHRTPRLPPDSGAAAHAPYELCRKDGAPFPALVGVHRVAGVAGDTGQFIVTVTDATQRQQNKERLDELAHYDALTGLPNRNRFEQRLQTAIERCSGTLAVLSLGVDRFDDINDSMGHRIGDRVLQTVAELLVRTVGDRGLVARSHGDQYVILLTEVGEDDASAQANAMIGELSNTLEVDGHQLRVPVSIGIAMYPRDGAAAPALLSSADTAQHEAKARGGRGYGFFTMQLKNAALKRVTLEAELRHALDREEFELHYQPKLRIQTGQLSGAEALVRWRSPTRGLVSPADFIPIAEESGLILPLGEWVMEETCRQAAIWRGEMGLDLSLAVNLSPKQLHMAQPAKMIDAILRRHKMPRAQFEVEMTESAIMEDIDLAVGRMSELAELGVRLAIDDFGTGYSSLSQLGRLPLATLKIDRSFVIGLALSPRDGALVRAIIEVAHALGMRVVAEGVETEEQLAALKLARCDDVQGYLIAKPLEPQAFATWARERNATAGAAPTGRATGPHVLFVDDDAAVIHSMTERLLRSGYQVTSFGDPFQALQAFRLRPESFDAAIARLWMPALSGLDLATELLKANPELPVVLTAASVRPEDRARASAAGVRDVVPKRELLEALGSVLEQQRLVASA